MLYATGEAPGEQGSRSARTPPSQDDVADVVLLPTRCGRPLAQAPNRQTDSSSCWDRLTAAWPSAKAVASTYSTGGSCARIRRSRGSSTFHTVTVSAAAIAASVAQNAAS